MNRRTDTVDRRTDTADRRTDTAGGRTHYLAEFLCPDFHLPTQKFNNIGFLLYICLMFARTQFYRTPIHDYVHPVSSSLFNKKKSSTGKENISIAENPRKKRGKLSKRKRSVILGMERGREKGGGEGDFKLRRDSGHGDGRG